ASVGASRWSAVAPASSRSVRPLSGAPGTPAAGPVAPEPVQAATASDSSAITALLLLSLRLRRISPPPGKFPSSARVRRGTTADLAASGAAEFPDADPPVAVAVCGLEAFGGGIEKLLQRDLAVAVRVHRLKTSLA